jgi:PAS domain S-box-containing protein
MAESKPAMNLSSADFEALLQANRILSSKLDDQEVIETVMELATKVVQAEASSLLLLDAAANELYFNVALGSVKEQVKQIRLKVGEGIAGWVAQQREPLIVNDVASDPRFTGKVDASTSFKTRAILAVPLLSKGDLVGVVEAINKRDGQPFTATDQQVLSAFAGQAAVAIQNARLFSEVRREREKLATVFASMSDGVLLLDSDGRVRLANPACARLLGAVAEDAAGKSLGADLLADFEASPPLPHPLRLQRLLTRVDLKRKSGKDFYLTALIRRLGDDESAGNPEGWIVILRDETETRLEGRLKQSFLSVVSHKLKTPLTSIVGYAPTLLEDNDNLTPFQKKAVTAIAEQGEHLAALVDKLLRFTIVESDSIARTPAEAPLKDLVQEALASLEPVRSAAKATVSVDPKLMSLPPVFVDRKLTVEAIKNVCENAMKFNDKPTKEVRIRADADGGMAVLQVSDNGVGIPPEDREKIFQKFHQVENHFTGQVPGAGLGLALCRKVIDAMGGRIRLESEIGKGTTVFIELPLGTREPK